MGDLAAEVTVTWNPASRRRTATDKPITPAPTTAADGREDEDNAKADGDEDEDAALAPAVFVAEMTALRRGALFGLLSGLLHGRRHGAVPTHMAIVAVFGADIIVTLATTHRTEECCCKPRRRSFVSRDGSRAATSGDDERNRALEKPNEGKCAFFQWCGLHFFSD